MENNLDIKFVPLTELVSAIIDNWGRTCPTTNEGIPLIATNCIRNENLYPTYEKIRYVSQDTYNTWFKGHPIAGDIIFVNKGTPGRVCLVPDRVDFCIAQDMVALRPDNRKIYPRYLFAILRSPQVQATINNMHVGTLIPHFKKGDFDRLLLPIHANRKTQKFIGDTYFHFCKKEHCNRRTNATLEAMAGALFKSWFVDFDPVIDNALAAGNDIPEPLAERAAYRQSLGNARKPLPEHIRKLFPAQFQETNIGPIPKGWEVKKIGEILELAYGKALTKADRKPGNIPVYGSGGIGGYHNEALMSGPGVIIGRKGTVGSVFWVEKDYYAIDTVFYVKPYQQQDLFWIFMHLNNLDIAHLQADSAVPGVNRHAIYAKTLVFPERSILNCFEDTIRGNRNMRTVCQDEIVSLETLRNTLLPKLISGQLRVPEAEEIAL